MEDINQTKSARLFCFDWITNELTYYDASEREKGKKYKSKEEPKVY